MTRSELSLQLRIQLLSLLAPDECCAKCRAAVPVEMLEVDHPSGRTWCKPHGQSIATDAERRAREFRSMRSAILDIVGCAALTRDQIAGWLHDEWGGGCSESDIGRALRVLIRDGCLLLDGDLYVGLDT